MNARTLVLTETLIPHDVVPWQEAVTMLFNAKVRVLETYDDVIGRVRFDQIEDFEHFLEDLPASAFDGDLVVLRTPAVLVLKNEIGRVKRGVKFSRQNVFARDHFRCVYCGFAGSFETLNYDHVVPRARGGRTIWENIVTTCYPCNTRKGDRSPEQAGMTLRVRPYKPRSLPLSTPRLRIRDAHPVWQGYLPDGAAA